MILLFLLAAFVPFNWLTIRQLLRIHPRGRRVTVALALAGTVMWLGIPFLRQLDAPMRIFRATFGPLWVGWTLFSLLYSLFLFMALLAWLPFHRRPFVVFARVPSRVFITLLLIAFVIGCWQALVPLRIEHVPIAIDNLAAEAEGTRITLLADLHVGLYSRPSRLREIFATAAAQRPDMVILAGDLVDDDPYFTPKLLEGTRSLPPSMPLLAVLGNHEMYGDPYAVIGRLRGSRIQLLVNEGRELRGLWIAGLSDYAASLKELHPDLDAALRRRPAGAVPIVVAHQPHAFDETRPRGLPLTLVAHTHGGQCGIRPLHWSVAGFFLRYHMGYYRVGPSQLYVNTGTGYWLFPFRLGMTPEITVIELRRR
jgi:predicted MPP superfamily phosphohydrolase